MDWWLRILKVGFWIIWPIHLLGSLGWLVATLIRGPIQGFGPWHSLYMLGASILIGVSTLRFFKWWDDKFGRD